MALGQQNTSYDVNQTPLTEPIRQALGVVPPMILRAIRTGSGINQTSLDWYEDEILALKANVTGPVDGTTGNILASSTTLDVSSANIFAVGDILEWDGERVKVSAVDYTNNQITVVRGYQGTTAVNHAPNLPAEVVSSANAESADVGIGSRVSTPTKYMNVTQIFSEYLSVSGTLEAVQVEWATDEVERQLRQKFNRLDALKAKSVLYGIRYDSATSAERTLGGINFFIVNKTNAGGVALTPDMLIDELIAMDNDGVFELNPNVQIWMNPNYMRVVNTWYNQKLMVNREDTRYGQIITSLVTNYGEIPIMYDRNIKVGDIFIFDPNFVEKRPLRPERREMLGKRGDRTEWQIVEEFTIKVGYLNAWRKIENVAAP